MGRTKVKFIFESDDLSPMELVDYVKRRTASLVMEITDFEALDYRGQDSGDSTQ